MVAPAIPVAQAIGRLGNWFNQELFGRPTTLPWGLEIDPVNRPVGYEQYATFHPTFLYEALWSLGVAGLLIVIDRSRKLRPGELFALYVLGYGIGRLWVEDLRIDQASLIARRAGQHLDERHPHRRLASPTWSSAAAVPADRFAGPRAGGRTAEQLARRPAAEADADAAKPTTVGRTPATPTPTASRRRRRRRSDVDADRRRRPSPEA